tara:strand:+ start:1155 stop:2222 length:1068 start_codon:yes stop_codon:yes gene_type:complete
MQNPWNNPNADKDVREDKKTGLESFLINLFSGKNSDNNVKVILAAVFFAVIGMWLLTGFFKIDADQQGVILRFGKFTRQVGPGLNYKLPQPLETVEKVSVTRIKKDSIGHSTSIDKISHSVMDQNNTSTDLSSYPKESQMLTGDENIIDMYFFVQWRIDNPINYLTSIKDSYKDPIVRTVVESVMRQVIGGVNISEALSERRLAIETNVKKELQNILAEYNAGIEIMSVGILYSYVAPEVRDSYRDVQSAKADREKYINHAQAYRNEVLPRAKGEAGAVVERALAMKNIDITKAEGEAKRFNKIYDAYLASKEITKKRMYIDTMEEIYKGSEKIILDKDISKSVLSFLPLDKVSN